MFEVVRVTQRQKVFKPKLEYQDTFTFQLNTTKKHKICYQIRNWVQKLSSQLSQKTCDNNNHYYTDFQKYCKQTKVLRIKSLIYLISFVDFVEDIFSTCRRIKRLNVVCQITQKKEHLVLDLIYTIGFAIRSWKSLKQPAWTSSSFI